jgi:hypothetical protein
MMFARVITTLKLRAPASGPGRRVQAAGRLFKATSSPILAFAGALYVEGYGDVMQPEVMLGESVQPPWRAAARLHVIGEARHVRFAREEPADLAGGLGRTERAHVQHVLGLMIWSARPWSRGRALRVRGLWDRTVVILGHLSHACSAGRQGVRRRPGSRRTSRGSTAGWLSLGRLG